MLSFGFMIGQRDKRPAGAHEAPGLAAPALEIRLPGDGRRPDNAHSITGSISQMWTTVPCNQDMAGWRRATVTPRVCVLPARGFLICL